MNQPTPEQLAAKLARFNEIVKPGDVIKYHEVEGEGPGIHYTTRGPAEILSGHSVVVWLNGKSGCVMTDHCQVLTAEEKAAQFADLMKDEGPPRTATNRGGPLCQVDGCGHSAIYNVDKPEMKRRVRLCSRHLDADLRATVDGKLLELPHLTEKADPTLTAAHFLNAETVVDSLIQNLAIQYQVEGTEWDRDTMQAHVNKRGALLVTKGLLLDEVERLLK